MKIKINEAKSIENEYSKDWSGIDRDIFDQIILLDPQTNVENNFIGPAAKQLLLPKYLNGETDLLERSEEIRNALTTYIANRGKVAPQYRNIANFPSVAEFITFMSDPANMEGNENIVREKPVKVEETGEQKLEKIWQKEYSNLTRDQFFQLVNIDPDSNVEKGRIGKIAKNLLLRLARAGDKAIFSKDLLSTLPTLVYKFYSIENFLSAEAKDLSKYKSIQDFTSLMIKGEPSDYVEYLKKCPEWQNIEYIGSTNIYDVVHPLTCAANAWIAGADSKVGGPGFSRDGSSASWGSNTYGHWCTTTPNYWRQHTGGSDRRELFCFIVRGNQGGKPRRALNNRQDNYQVEMNYSGDICEAADGREDVSYAKFEQMLKKDPELYTLLNAYGANRNGYFSNNELIKSGVKKLATYHKYEYKGGRLSNDDIAGVKSYCHILNIANGVVKIPALTFADCLALGEINFSDTVTEIGTQAFKNCASLIHLTLPPRIEAIRAQAFANCIALRGTTRLPETLEYIGRNAFEGTNVTLSILKNRPEGSLFIDVDQNAENPYAWYKEHAKLVNESLEPINENIPKAIVNTGFIPKMKAYLNGEAIDFGKVQFDTRTKDQACDFVGLAFDDEEGITRTKSKSEFYNNLSQLLFIYADDFAFWVYADGDKAPSRSHMSNIPPANWDAVIQAHPVLTDKYAGGFRASNGNRFYKTNYAFQPQDFWMCIQTADKIYQTDLKDYLYYGHERGETHLDRRLRAENAFNSGTVMPGIEEFEKELPDGSTEVIWSGDKALTRKKEVDTYQKQLSDGTASYVATMPRSQDTGRHWGDKKAFRMHPPILAMTYSDKDRGYQKNINLFVDLLNKETLAYYKYDALRLYSKKYKNKLKLVDRLFLEQKVKEALKEYEAARDTLIRFKKTFVRNFDYHTLAYNTELENRKKKFAEKLNGWRERLIAAKTKQRELQSALAEAKRWTIDKSAKYQAIIDSTNNAQIRVADIDRQIAAQNAALTQLTSTRAQLEARIEEHRRAIEELVAQIEALPGRAEEIGNMITELEANRQRALEAVVNSEKIIESKLEELTKEREAEVAKLEKDYEEISKLLRDEGVYMFSDKKQKEEDPELLKKFKADRPEPYQIPEEPELPEAPAVSGTMGGLIDSIINF